MDSQHIRSHPEFDDHKKVISLFDKRSGLRGFIAIHRTFFNTHLLRATSLGGVRMKPYASEEEALTDVLRLSRGMSYKAALAGIDFGGAKAVIIGDPKTQKTNDLLLAFVAHVSELDGEYVCAEDMGVGVHDIDCMHKLTRFTAGGSLGLRGSGDPSRMTALGVYKSIEVCLEKIFGNQSVRERKISIPGVGHVGRDLAVMCMRNGARIFIADTNKETLKNVSTTLSEDEWNIQRDGTFTIAEPEEINTLDVDVYAPCAGGAVLNDETIPRLRCRAIVGSANNQLAEARHGDMLHPKGILYAPDYVVNAGGLINVAYEFKSVGYDEMKARAHILRIPHTLRKIFTQNEQEGVAPHRVADAMALKIVSERNVC